MIANPGGRAIKGVSLKPCDFLYCWFGAQGCLSLVFVLCFVADHSPRGVPPGLGLCICVTVCNLEISTTTQSRTELGWCATEEEKEEEEQHEE
jgi:hypothetical protein